MTLSRVGALLSQAFPCLVSQPVDALSGLTVTGLVGEAVNGVVGHQAQRREWKVGPGATPA